LSPSPGSSSGNRQAGDATPDQPVNGFEVLEKLAALPISTWNYKGEDPAIRHLGPMAQDFAASFGLGADDRTINMLDANGVAMVAIQALYRRVQQLEAEISELRSPS
jgi:hypothetical protein